MNVRSWRLIVDYIKTLWLRVRGCCACGNKAVAHGYCDECLEYPEG